MPVLRMPQDNSIAESLGGLGSALSQAWNPKTRAEAMMLQRMMMLRDLEYQKQLNEYNANQAAIRHFGYLTPDQQTMVAQMIYRGEPMEKVRAVAAQISNEGKKFDGLPGDQRIAAWNSMHPDAPWKGPGMPIFGPKDQAEEDTRVAGAEGQKTYAQKTNEAKAADEHMRGLFAQMPAANDVSPDAVVKRAQLYSQAFPNMKPPDNGIWLTGDPAVTRLSQALDTHMEFEKNRAIESGKAAGGGIDATGKVFPWRNPGTFTYDPGLGYLSNGRPVGVGGTGGGAPGAPGAAGDTTMPNPALSGGKALPLTSETPAGTVVGMSPTASKLAEGATPDQQKYINDTLQAGEDADKVMPKIGQLYQLVQMIGASGPGASLQTALQSKFLETYHYAPNDKAEAIALANQLYLSQLTALHSEFPRGIAKPELFPARMQLGDPTLPMKTAISMLANQTAQVQAAQAKRDLALNVGDRGLDYYSFRRQSIDIEKKAEQVAADLRKSMGGVDTSKFRTLEDAQAGAGKPPGGAPGAPGAAPVTAAPSVSGAQPQVSGPQPQQPASAPGPAASPAPIPEPPHPALLSEETLSPGAFPGAPPAAMPQPAAGVQAPQPPGAFSPGALPPGVVIDFRNGVPVPRGSP